MLSLLSLRGMFLALMAACTAFCTPRALAQGDDVVVSVPPQQNEKWPPPLTNLQPSVVDAITQLFKDGLPDPRGCEYREIEIAESKKWTFKTNGWVLPGTGAQKYAIAWNGVIYPVGSVGVPVDLPKEIATIPAGQRRFRGYGVGWPMSDQLSSNVKYGALPIHVAFLLRLGEGKLAQEMWDSGYADQGNIPVPDPYVDMAGLWLDRWYNRAAQAFLNHDDASALAICRQVSPVIARVKANAIARGIVDPWPVMKYSNHLWQLPWLEADLEKRVRENPYTPVIESGQPASGPERIAALIHDLEQSYAEQFSNPGETEIVDDPTVQALIKEGYPAVEPLLKCLVEDNRLTRARYTQGMGFDGPIIPVYEAAYEALFRILKVSFPLFEDDSHDYRKQKEPRDMSFDDRRALAAKIDAVWQKNKGMTPAENGYITLKDNTAGAQAWYRAIDSIVQPADGTFTSYRLIIPSGGSYQLYQGKVPFKALGEIFRAKTNPSVSELIIKRFNQLIVQSSSDKNISFDPVGKLILALADWDGKAHLDDIRDMARSFHARFPHEQGAFVSTLQTEAMIYRKRLELGDSRALQDYADWLVAINPTEWCNFDLTNPFQIMWHYPNDPVIEQAAEKLFNSKNSAWIPLNRVKPLNESSTLADLVTTPLIGLAAFRQEVLRRLDDPSIDGTVQLNENGNVGCMLTDDVHQDFTVSSCKGDPLGPRVGSSISFRTCDWFAYELSQLDGFPRIGLYWPQAQRDAAVAACKAVLLQYGDAFQSPAQDPYDESVYGSQDRARAAFPKFDHPATPDDVKLGHAIFSLSGTTRICQMPSFPIEAWRPNRKTDPSEGSETTADGASKSIIMYNTEGRVWQAEEVLRDGKWDRYYGFIGRYQLEKVSAAEIRFSYQGANGNVTKEISGTIEGPQDYVQSQPNFSFATHNFYQLDSPLPVKVKISNGSGLDQAIPQALMLPPGAKMTLPQGISLILSYSEKIPPKVVSFSGPSFNYGSWQDVPLRKEVQIAASDTPGPILIPTKDFTVLDTDLRDFFDTSRPGTYRVKALFHLPGQAPDKSNEITFSVSDPMH
jgi:hypothetical protein